MAKFFEPIGEDCQCYLIPRRAVTAHGAKPPAISLAHTSSNLPLPSRPSNLKASLRTWTRLASAGQSVRPGPSTTILILQSRELRVLLFNCRALQSVAEHSCRGAKLCDSTAGCVDTAEICTHIA